MSDDLFPLRKEYRPAITVTEGSRPNERVVWIAGKFYLAKQKGKVWTLIGTGSAEHTCAGWRKR